MENKPSNAEQALPPEQAAASDIECRLPTSPAHLPLRTQDVLRLRNKGVLPGARCCRSTLRSDLLRNA